MNPSLSLIERAKVATGLESDGALANRLGVSRPYISLIRNRDQQMSDEKIIAVAKLAGFNEASELVKVHLRTAKTPEAIAAWEKIAQMVAEDGIEPPTRGFSIPMSDRAPRRMMRRRSHFRNSYEQHGHRAVI